MILLSGTLPNPEKAVAVMGISYTLVSGVFTVPVGLGGAVSTRVANELGAGNGLRARSAARAGAVLGVAVMLGFSAAVLLFRHVYGEARTPPCDSQVKLGGMVCLRFYMEVGCRAAAFGVAVMLATSAAVLLFWRIYCEARQCKRR